MINFSLFFSILPILTEACLQTIIIAFLSTILGFAGGTCIALIEYQKNKILCIFTSLYLSVIRGTPMIVQIVFFYYVFNLPFEPIYISILAIGFNSAAYISQTIKTGIRSISKGEIEAARVMGFSSMQITRYIVLPQAFRAIFPSLGNEFVTLIKDSSLAYVIGVNELFKVGKNLTATSYDVITIYFAITLFYFLMTTTVSFLLSLYEKKIGHTC